ncbi:MAG: hypothetical protein Q9225_006335 [Loekoesia sp. 1 TL-2023]
MTPPHPDVPSPLLPRPTAQEPISYIPAAPKEDDQTTAATTQASESNPVHKRKRLMRGLKRDYEQAKAAAAVTEESAEDKPKELFKRPKLPRHKKKKKTLAEITAECMMTLD